MPARRRLPGAPAQRRRAARGREGAGRGDAGPGPGPDRGHRAPGSTATRRRATSRSGGPSARAGASPQGRGRREAARAAEAVTRPRRRPWHVVCQVCGSGDDEAQLVLRDDCDAGAAHGCLELGAVPAPWRCDACARPRRRSGGRRREERGGAADDDADLVCAPSGGRSSRPTPRGRAMPRWPVVGDRLQRHNDVDPLEAEHVRARVSDFQAPPPEGYESPSRPRRCSAWSRRCPRAAPRRRSATSTWRSRTASGSAARCASRRRRTR